LSLIDGDKVFTLDELAQKYFRQWLAVKVLERDHNGQPVKVIFLERDVNVMGVRQLTGVKDLCTMYTGPIPETDHLGMF
jgi:hypothetical protein